MKEDLHTSDSQKNDIKKFDRLSEEINNLKSDINSNAIELKNVHHLLVQKSNRSILIGFILLAIVTTFCILFIMHIKTSLDDELGTIKISPQVQSQEYKIENQIDYYTRILKLEHQIETFEKAIDSGKWILGFIITIIGVLIAYNKYSFDKRQEEERHKLDIHLKSLQENNDELFKKSKENINAVTELIGSYKSMIEVANEASKILEKAENQANEWKERKNIEIDNLNNEVKELSNVLLGEKNWDNYKEKAYENRLNKFVNSFTPLEQDDKTQNVFNSDCYLLVALHYMSQVLFQKAIEYLDIAIEKVTQRKEIQNHILDCFFHKAIIYYNFSFYDEAMEMFNKALQINEHNIRIKTYLPEVEHLKFLNRLDSFKDNNGFLNIPKEIELELEDKHEKINSMFLSIIQDIEIIIDYTNPKDPNRIKLAIAYIKLGNHIYRFPPKKNISFEQYHERLESALNYYNKALEVEKKFNIDETKYFYLSKLSYAQVVLANHFLLNKPHDKSEIEKAERYIKDVFPIIRNKAGKTREGKISMMYYYMLSICEFYLKKVDISYQPIDFDDEILIAQQNLPLALEFNDHKEEIRIFSPHTKKDLIVDALLEEKNNLKNW